MAAKSKPAVKSSTADVAGMKARQCAKIQELGQALIEAGFEALDEQAAALGLPRSTDINEGRMKILYLEDKTIITC